MLVVVPQEGAIHIIILVMSVIACGSKQNAAEHGDVIGRQCEINKLVIVNNKTTTKNGNQGLHFSHCNLIGGNLPIRNNYLFQSMSNMKGRCGKKLHHLFWLLLDQFSIDQFFLYF